MASDNESLRSRSYVKILDLVSEGEIEGLVDGKRSVYFNETPVENQDGSENFAGVTVVEKAGTNGQGVIYFASAVENEVFVETELKNGSPGPLVRTITDDDVTGVRVRVRVPALFTVNDKGDIKGTSVRVKIYVQSNGGGYVQKIDNTIQGKTSNGYDRDYEILLTGSAPWNIKLERLTSDSTSTNTQNDTIWKSYTEIIHSKLRYPNSAIFGVRFDSETFSGTPRRAYDVKLLKVKVPSNYNVASRTYSGVWDGTFKDDKEWTDNPAWCFYDMVTNTRYGLGGHVPESHVDKWALYQISQYCDELVPDGQGGYEPRFTCNLYIQSRNEAFKIIQDMASIFRGMVYWASGALTSSQDAPSDPVALYNTSNVVDGSFSYSGTASKARHSVALVTWNDPSDFYRQKVEYVEDAAAIARFGVVETEITAVGCTSRGQANRMGRWLLYAEQNETETVTFRTGLEGCLARPGQIIKVQDPTRAGSRLGGRITSATSNTVTVDADFTLPSGATLYVMCPDGSVESKVVASKTGNVITISGSFTSTPQNGAVWMVSAASVEAQSFRVIAMSEATDGQIEITALKHDDGKYAAVEDGLKLPTRDFTTLNVVPLPPSSVSISEILYESKAEVRTRVTVDWDRNTSAGSYLVSYRVDDGNFINLPETQNTTIDIEDAPAGTYTVRIRSVSPLGRVGNYGETQSVIFGKTLPPADVANFSLIPTNGFAYLSWDKATDLDVLVGGTVRIRHTPRTTGAEWSDCVDILPALPGASRNANAPLLSGTYLAKFVDSLGNASATEAIIVTTVPEGLARNVVQTIDEAPSFAGVRSSTFRYASTPSGLALTGSALVDDYTDNVDDWDDMDFLGGVASSGTYTFANSVDLGASYASRISASIKATSFDTVDRINSRTDLVDSWSDFDGGNFDDVNAVLYMRTTADDPAATPTWSEWKPFFVGEYTARAFQFQVRLTSGNAIHNISVDTLSVTVDMPDRTLSGSGIVSGAGTYSVAFSEPFKAAPSVNITANNLASGDYWQISNTTATGFDIIFKNTAGTAVSRTFDFLAKGYGRRT